MVEFENADRTLYSIIEWVVGTVCANPAEEGLAEMALYLLLSDFSRSVRQVQQEILRNVQHELLLVPIEVSDADSLFRHDAIVAERATDMTLIVLVPPVFYQIPRLQHGRIAQ